MLRFLEGEAWMRSVLTCENKEKIWNGAKNYAGLAKRRSLMISKVDALTSRKLVRFPVEAWFPSFGVGIKSDWVTVVACCRWLNAASWTSVLVLPCWSLWFIGVTVRQELRNCLPPLTACIVSLGSMKARSQERALRSVQPQGESCVLWVCCLPQ